MNRRKFFTAVAAVAAAPAIAKVPTLEDPRGPASKSWRYFYSPDHFKETLWPGIEAWWKEQYDGRT